MKKTYGWKFYSPETEKKFTELLDTLDGNSVNEKLNFFWSRLFEIKDMKDTETVEPHDIADNFLDTYYTCKDCQLALKVRRLPCVEDRKPDLPSVAPTHCKNCFMYLKRQIPESWWKT